MVDVKALMQAAKNTTVPSCEERMGLLMDELLAKNSAPDKATQ